MQNKDHWYDGIFYDKIIAPNQDKAYEVVKSIIKKECVILDVGCGTGRLAFKLQNNFSFYDGVDPSKKNINTAIKNLSINYSSNIAFHHTDVSEFLKSNGRNYDYAVISYVIHEIDEDKREKVLIEVSNFASKIIVIDYLFPRPKGFWSFLNEVVEFAAGRSHYKNFKSFIKLNGIPGLALRSNLKIEKEVKNSPLTSHIVVLSR